MTRFAVFVGQKTAFFQKPNILYHLVLEKSIVFLKVFSVFILELEKLVGCDDFGVWILKWRLFNRCFMGSYAYRVASFLIVGRVGGVR